MESTTSQSQSTTLLEWEEAVDEMAQVHPALEWQVIHQWQVSRTGSVRVDGDDVENIQQDWSYIRVMETLWGKRTWKTFMKAWEEVSVQSLEEKMSAAQTDEDEASLSDERLL